MPEIRYTEVYEEGTGRLIGHEPYKVSDEELQHEHDLALLQDILSQSPPAQGLPHLYEAVRILARLTLRLPK